MTESERRVAEFVRWEREYTDGWVCERDGLEIPDDASDRFLQGVDDCNDAKNEGRDIYWSQK